MQSKDSGARTASPAPGELSRRARRLWLGLILAAYLVVTVLYGLVNPLFEAPDEHWHFFTAQYIAENGRLPAVAPGDGYDTWLSQEAAQPPLYYLLSGLLIAPIDTSSAREDVWPNKFASVGDAGALININQFIHAESETWPWQGYAQAAHLLRWFSTFLGMGTLIFIYLGGRLLWPQDTYRALLAAALVAFLPQYNFLHAAVSNDPLIIFLISAALWQLIRVWQGEVTRARLLLLGITIGLAALTKNQGIPLLLYATGVLVLLAVRSAYAPVAATGQPAAPDISGWHLLGASALFVVFPALLLSGWLWARNWLLYDDMTAMNQFIRIAGGDRAYSLLQVLRETPGLWLSTYAVFGWFNLRAPNWVYWFWSGLVGLALIGAAWATLKSYRARSRKPPPPTPPPPSTGFGKRLGGLLQQGWVLPFLLALWVAAVYAGLVLFMMQTEAAQGRLLFPALLPLSLGMAAGLTAVPALHRLSLLVPPAALAVTLYCLFYVVQPAYETPRTIVDLPEEAQELDAQMGGGVKLVGAVVESATVLPGEALWLTLYWRADDVAEQAPEFVLSVFGRENEEIGKVHSYHGRGLYPAGLWPDGQIIEDRFALWIDESAKAPVLAVIDGTLLDGATVRVGEIKLEPEEWPADEGNAVAEFGADIALLDVRVNPESAYPGEQITLDLHWLALGEPRQELTTLVHLGQPDAAPLATGDRPPLDGRYPTHVWESGEQIEDGYDLRLPEALSPGRYPLWIGLYDRQSLVRLPVTIAGEVQPYDVYLAGWIEVK